MGRKKEKASLKVFTLKSWDSVVYDTWVESVGFVKSHGGRVLCR